jgi:hypothetical protein
MASLVTLNVECWPKKVPFTITRDLFPSLRAVNVTLEKASPEPFDLWGGRGSGAGSGSDGDGAPALLTRLTARADENAPGKWLGEPPLLVSARTLAALAPTLESLESARPVTYGEPMARLLPCLGALSRLTSLSLDGDYDWEPHEADGNAGRWLRSSRTLMSQLGRSLRSLELIESSSACDINALSLPPAVSLLTALTRLDACNFFIKSVGGLRQLTGLRHLSMMQYFADDWQEDERPHPPLLGRDLEGLVSLTCLRLTHAARCNAPALESGLPKLACLVVDPTNLPVTRAVRARVARGGLAVFQADTEVPHLVPSPLTLADLDAAIAAINDSGDEARDAQRHEHQHQELLAMVESWEQQDAREAWGA